jgi:hypothetical protein
MLTLGYTIYIECSCWMGCVGSVSKSCEFLKRYPPWMQAGCAALKAGVAHTHTVFKSCHRPTPNYAVEQLGWYVLQAWREFRTGKSMYNPFTLLRFQMEPRKWATKSNKTTIFHTLLSGFVYVKIRGVRYPNSTACCEALLSKEILGMVFDGSIRFKIWSPASWMVYMENPINGW